MSKDLNISHVAYQWLVPVMKGQLDKTIRKAKIKSDEW